MARDVEAHVTQRAPFLSAFGRFAFVSGVGWLFDVAVLAGLTRLAAWPPFAANLVSSLLAASAVFLFTRKRVHAGQDGAVPGRLAGYLIYTLAVILAASALMQALADALAGGFTPTAAALLAKVVVTPPQLLSNFLVSRFISRWAACAPAPAQGAS